MELRTHIRAQILAPICARVHILALIWSALYACALVCAPHVPCFCPGSPYAPSSPAFCTSFLQDVEDGESGKQLVEDLLPHVGRQEGDDGGEVGDEAEQTQAREHHALAPELEVLPNLAEKKTERFGWCKFYVYLWKLWLFCFFTVDSIFSFFCLVLLTY